jgi:hypothetical protein
MVFSVLLVSTMLAKTTIEYDCRDTVVENSSQETWTKHDNNVLANAMDRCVVHFPNSPCLIKFIKTDVRTYRAICGEP